MSDWVNGTCVKCGQEFLFWKDNTGKRCNECERQGVIYPEPTASIEYKQLFNKYQEVVTAHDFQVSLNKELQRLIRQIQPEVEKLNSQLEIAAVAFKKIEDTPGGYEADIRQIASETVERIWPNDPL